MTLLAPSTDFTSRDFDALRARLFTLVDSVFPEWTDRDVAGFGNLLVEMFAFVGDVLSYYGDNQARESRLVTATQRKNVIALAHMLGYRLSGATAATAEVEFRLPSPPRARVPLVAGTAVRTRDVSNPLRYLLLHDVAIEAGADPPVVVGTVEHAMSHRQVFDVRSLRGTDLLLNRTPFLDGSARIVGTNGEYAEVVSLLSSGPNDRHFMVLVDQNDHATIRFGDGRTGAMPVGSVDVRYKTGGGASGNVDAGQLSVFDGVPKDVEGNPVALTLSNPARASGGTDRESIASAKLLAPLSLRATTRSVAREDFEVHALELPQVARALMLTSNEDRAIQENSGVLYVVPQGGGVPTPAVKNLVRRQVTEVYPCTLTFQVDVRDPIYRRVDIRTRIFVRAGQRPEAVRDRIRERLTQAFRVTKGQGAEPGQTEATRNLAVNFGYYLRANDDSAGGELAYSDIYNLIRDTDGVRKMGDHHGDLLLNGLPADVKLRPAEFPSLGDIVVMDETGRVV